jgi:hypothetical protein
VAVGTPLPGNRNDCRAYTESGVKSWTQDHYRTAFSVMSTWDARIRIHDHEFEDAEREDFARMRCDIHKALKAGLDRTRASEAGT